MRKQILAHGRKKMSLYSYWKKSLTSTSSLLLPKVVENSAFHAANENVATATTECGKCKRGPYHHHYNAKVRAKIAKYIAKYASKNGNKSAVEKFSVRLGHSISEATVELQSNVKFKGRQMTLMTKTLNKKGVNFKGFTVIIYVSRECPCILLMQGCSHDIFEWSDRTDKLVTHLRTANIFTPPYQRQLEALLLQCSQPCSKAR